MLKVTGFSNGSLRVKDCRIGEKCVLADADADADAGYKMLWMVHVQNTHPGKSDVQGRRE